MNQFPEEIYGLIVDELGDRDRFGRFGILSRKFNALSFALPYRHLNISFKDVQNAISLANAGKPVLLTPSQSLGSFGLSKIKGGLLTNAKKIDGAFVEEIHIDEGVVDTRFLTELLSLCKNCRTLSIFSLARLGCFDFSPYSHLSSLSIDRMDYLDELKFGALEHLSIKAKYQATQGYEIELMLISPQNDRVSKHIENIPTLQSLELSTDFFVSQAVLSKLAAYKVLPSMNNAPSFPMEFQYISRADPYPYLEPTFSPGWQIPPPPQPPQPQPQPEPQLVSNFYELSSRGNASRGKAHSYISNSRAQSGASSSKPPQ